MFQGKVILSFYGQKHPRLFTGDLVKGYNASYHCTVGMAPDHVNVKNEKEVWDRMYGKCLSRKVKKG